MIFSRGRHTDYQALHSLLTFRTDGSHRIFRLASHGERVVRCPLARRFGREHSQKRKEKFTEFLLWVMVLLLSVWVSLSLLRACLD